MRRRLPAAALLGAVSVAGFAPFELFPLPLIGVGLLFRLWRGATPRRAALLGLAWGLGFFLTGVSWVYVSMHDVGGMPAPIAALAALLFCAVLALFPMLAGFGFGKLGASTEWRDALLAAACWSLAEWLRGWVLTGFPWLALGYSQTPPSPLAGYAPLVGVYGVGFVAALIAAFLAFNWRSKVSIAVVVILAGMGLTLRQVAWTEPVGAPVSVSLLQGNIPQSLKWEPGRARQSLEIYAQLAESHPATLTVLPETALPMLLGQVPDRILQRLTKNGSVLFGVPVQSSDGGYANAAVALASPPQSAPPQFYAKAHLVPFGEYVPPGFSWFLALMHIPMSDFTPGQDVQKPMELAGQKVAPNICYEDIFGEAIRQSLPTATLLVNLSNTAWFGDSLAQPQHLQIARMRAMETGRTMLRATNTGMTAMVQPDGRVAAVLPPFATAALHVDAQGYRGATPYVRWGNGVAVLAALLAFLPALAGARKRLAAA